MYFSVFLKIFAKIIVKLKPKSVSKPSLLTKCVSLTYFYLNNFQK